MTEQEFLEIVSLHCETYYKPEPKKGYRQRDYGEVDGLKRRSGKLLKEINLDDAILVKWCTGGIGGGSCWDEGESIHYATTGEQEPDFEDLDIILDLVSPNLTYQDYKKLLHSVKPSLIEYSDWSENEYYGNSTNYGCKKIILRRLWERLQGLGVV